jgi:hypothetical protein
LRTDWSELAKELSEMGKNTGKGIGHECICGCGGLTKSVFYPGCDHGFYSRLVDLYAGGSKDAGKLLTTPKPEGFGRYNQAELDRVVAERGKAKGVKINSSASELARKVLTGK